tara:strand:- start:15 stop:152 length:138 start_codon:yes stop_codon:yes gene_type:complete
MMAIPDFNYPRIKREQGKKFYLKYYFYKIYKLFENLILYFLFYLN